MDKSVIDRLAQDEAFLEKILGLDTPEEVQIAFKEKGVELTLEEIEIFAQIVKLAVENDGVLSDEVLERISGGVEGAEIAEGAETVEGIKINYKKVRDISLIFMGVVVSLSSLYLVSTVNRFETKVDGLAQSKVGWLLGFRKK